MSNSQVDFYENGALLGRHYSYIPTGSLPIRFSAYTYIYGPPSAIEIKVAWVKVTSAAISQSGDYLRITVPAAANAYADVYSKSSFPVGTTFEARVYVSKGQWYDHKGIGYANGMVWADCGSGETEAAIWRGQDTDKYIETKTGSTSYCAFRESDYPPGWRTIRIVRVGTTQVDFCEDENPLGVHTSYIPTGYLPIRFSAYTYIWGPSSPITIWVNWVKVTQP